MHVPVSLCTSYSMADKKALVDSGATNNFIHPWFAERMKLGTQKLAQFCNIWNIDGSLNKGGLLTDYIDLDIQTKNAHKIMCFLVTNLEGEDIILGYPWLAAFKPPITWSTATIDIASLPIVLCTIHPHLHHAQTTIACIQLMEDVTTYDFSFLLPFFIYHMYFYSQSHDWWLSILTGLTRSHPLLSHCYILVDVAVWLGLLGGSCFISDVHNVRTLGLNK